MKCLFALGVEDKQSAAEWLCPVYNVFSVLVSPFCWLLYMCFFFLVLPGDFMFLTPFER